MSRVSFTALPPPSSPLPQGGGEDLFSFSITPSHHNTPRQSLTLGELLKRVDDAQTDINHNNNVVLDLGFPSPPTTSSFPFVLSFTNLAYSVKIRTKMALPSPFSCCCAARQKTCPAKTTLGGETSSPAKTKVLLNNISGEAREGEIMGVLGASGSGKSTLIDALADRISRDSLKGTVRLNGDVLESKLQKVISAYVMQDDLLFPMLTVEETLMFSAEFRLPRSLSASKKRARVQALIDQLGLRSAATTVIGDEGHRGVSGGERRRVSIGTDIIHDPILLFLDEPTSGLDSTSAYSLSSGSFRLQFPNTQIFLFRSHHRRTSYTYKHYFFLQDLQFVDVSLDDEDFVPSEDSGSVELQRRVVVPVEIVDSDDAVAAFLHRQRDVEAHESGGAGDENRVTSASTAAVVSWLRLLPDEAVPLRAGRRRRTEGEAEKTREKNRRRILIKKKMGQRGENRKRTRAKMSKSAIFKNKKEN